MIDPTNIDFDNLNPPTSVAAPEEKNSVIILLAMAAIFIASYVGYHYLNFNNNEEKDR